MSTENHEKYVKYESYERNRLVKRPNNLKLEGDFYSVTENADKFIQYILSKRPDLARRSTSLKLEGEMDVKTETNEKFKAPEYQPRPPLCKKYTNLHLEGDLEIVSDYREKYIPYEYQQRPQLTKRSTNLHISGDLDLMPEYRASFKEYRVERIFPKFPSDNLTPETFFKENYDEAKFDRNLHPEIPFLRGDGYGSKTASKSFEYSKRERSVSPIPKKSLERQNRFEVDEVANKLEAREMGNVEESHEIKDKRDINGIETVETDNIKAKVNEYNKDNEVAGVLKEKQTRPKKDFVENGYQENFKQVEVRKEMPKPQIYIQKETHMRDTSERRKRLQYDAHLKSETRFDINPEYRSSFVDFPRKRPSVRKPESHLFSEGEVSTIYFFFCHIHIRGLKEISIEKSFCELNF